ncbi:hypothetical protein QTP86_000356 [Hemibagrus guttatus]|nr:hypothetical protein QTP86_000356 [Hemibagrus guttatus]
MAVVVNPGLDRSGVTMKLMDEVAGIVAVRHCKTNVVTASVDAINFHRKIKKGVATANHLSPPIPIFCILNPCTH